MLNIFLPNVQPNALSLALEFRNQKRSGDRGLKSRVGFGDNFAKCQNPTHISNLVGDNVKSRVGIRNHKSRVKCKGTRSPDLL